MQHVSLKVEIDLALSSQNWASTILTEDGYSPEVRGLEQKSDFGEVSLFT